MIHEKNLKVCFPRSKRENGQKPYWTILPQMNLISNGLLGQKWVSTDPKDPNRCTQCLWMTNWIHIDQLNHKMFPYFDRSYEISMCKRSKIDLKGQIWKRRPRKPKQGLFSHSFNSWAGFIHANIKIWLSRFIFLAFWSKYSPKMTKYWPKIPKNTF